MPTEPMPGAGATPTAEELLTSINELCEAYALARSTRALAQHAETPAEYDNLTARAEHWELSVRTRFDALADTVEAAFPRGARIEAFLPVRVLPNGHVEIHARDQHTRPVVLALSGPEAVTVGVHLTAYAAIGLDRTGTKVDRVLPPMITDPPPATTTDARPGGPAALMTAGPAAPARGVATAPAGHRRHA
ncbi:hypothetical protein [Couchioplanes caeruleus]|uniref:Uncharacterized protein n=2 Tax=Couchioplanes caeruleus TaxID=56438 RepID=A0A1K0GPQ8_9ACTN|nr:hypothetical protein [Couchioplanes caeruleus]OJF13148.1 hypothetical protein BG844_16815 [Couchioplanes caeruleus subsp. caeruleus]ROP28108.1 hypothetical protein EDD30_0817 [Couchioplanes caeruleus]